ncbi:helix-turn-helix domain-containing protein [Streptomyces sp. URMC 129]|uniref:helix-turn-helix domain-containing protein n=1 Tax=Streptomyces sp. URMC 129 TaxID=3423407 RepID=UPI003F19CD23
MELNDAEGKVTPRGMLGKTLNRLRTDAKLSLRALADQVGYPHSYISRVEHGEQLPSEPFADALDSHFGTGDLFSDLLEMAQDSLIADYSRAVVSKEKDAIRIRVFTSSIIPGLLQTEDYARELFRSGRISESEDELHSRAAARMKRKRIFEAAEPPLYWAIMDEAALRRPTPDNACMAAQIEHLTQVVEKPNITVQVLPFEQGLHSMLGGSLTLLSLKNGTEVGLVESFKTGHPVESPKRVVELVQLFEMACSKALSEPESLEVIRGYLKEYGK